jgi:hypothetical protein
VKPEIGTVRLHLIIVSMSLSTFIVAIDRSIIATAMYRPQILADRSLLDHG